MKFCIAVLFSVMLVALPAWAQDAAPCKGVTCSGAGNCVVAAHGGPACACFKGYSPDAVGLNCLAIGSGATPASSVLPTAGTKASTLEAKKLKLEWRKERNRAIGGAVATAVGIGLFVPGVVLFATGKGVFVGNTLLLLFGVAMITAGLTNAIIGAIRMDRIKAKLGKHSVLSGLRLLDDVCLYLQPTGMALTF